MSRESKSPAKRKTGKVIVAPSILSADPMRFGEEIESVEFAGADWHHVDVMDGHFVPNLTIGPHVIRALKSKAKCLLDVHIMVTNPDEVAVEYVKAGADILAFPIETVRHGHRLCAAIRDAGARPGVAINPSTSLELLRGILPWIDLINVMSVNPGFGGQQFIPETVSKIEKLSSMLRAEGHGERIFIEVDGGINAETAKKVVAAGARVLVAGNYVYTSKDRVKAIASLRV